MLQSLLARLRGANDDEKGFTLIELLVVVLIIGILAAIALPTFLGQQKKGQDASAKSDARNLVTMVESCFADSQDYGSCTTASALNPSGLDIVDGSATPNQGQVKVTSSGTTSYDIQAVSKSGINYYITKTSGGAPVRSCDSPGNGGCKNTAPGANNHSGANGSW